MTAGQVALVAGVGATAGLGAALARRFSLSGFTVVVAGRTQDALDAVVASVEAQGGRAVANLCDLTQEAEVERLVREAESVGPLRVGIYNAGNNVPSASLETSAAAFEALWRVGTLGGFVFGREVLKRMLPRSSGTLLFSGASASLRGRPKFAAFAAAKAGLRAVSQSFAREFGPQGIHVAHVVIDGGINGERLRRAAPEMAAARGESGLLKPEAIAEAYWQLHAQDPTAWSQEIDLRPYREPF